MHILCLRNNITAHGDIIAYTTIGTVKATDIIHSPRGYNCVHALTFVDFLGKRIQCLNQISVGVILLTIRLPTAVVAA